MKKWNFETGLACPKCKKKLKVSKNLARCGSCAVSYPKLNGFWALISLANPELVRSAKEYDKAHAKSAGRISDGSYEILASFARGNRTLDIACGQGFIEELEHDVIGLDFSFESLKKAKSRGAKNLVWATAENLPFLPNSFDLAICSGSLEQFVDPAKAILEMGRVAKIQVLTVHREFNFPFASTFRKITTKLLQVRDQPIERPFRWFELEKILTAAKLKIIYKGFWTFPVNFGKVFAPLPVFQNIPSCFFVITIKPD